MPLSSWTRNKATGECLFELKIDSDFVRSSLAFTVLKEHVKYAESKHEICAI